MVQGGQIDPIMAIKAHVLNMNDEQKATFFKETGIDVSAINLMNYKVAENYCKTHNINLGGVSAWNTAAEMKKEADAKYAAADESWNNWHAILNQANKAESNARYQAGIFLDRARKDAHRQGTEELGGENYNKYMTYTKNASEAYSTFRMALSGEWQAVEAKKHANNLAAISIFGQKGTVS